MSDTEVQIGGEIQIDSKINLEKTSSGEEKSSSEEDVYTIESLTLEVDTSSPIPQLLSKTNTLPSPPIFYLIS